MHTSEEAQNLLSREQIADYQRDGVICVRGMYSPIWVERLTAALDEHYTKPTIDLPGVRSSFRSDAFTWLTDDSIRDFILEGPSAHVARQVMQSHKVNFFYDQLFIKPALTPDHTPWHHDATFWPVAGEQITSIWTSVDAVDADSSALEFVAGSHAWNKRWKPVGAGGTIMSDEDLEHVPDIDGDRSAYDIVSWDLQPGDALIFHARTLHGARGNRSANRGRRALTTRWCGDDALYQPIAGGMPIPWRIDLKPGDALDSYLFPRMLPVADKGHLAKRMAGPISPEPDALAKALHQITSADRVPVKMGF